MALTLDFKLMWCSGPASSMEKRSMSVASFQMIWWNTALLATGITNESDVVHGLDKAVTVIHGSRPTM